jgi:hypothetical protein
MGPSSCVFALPLAAARAVHCHNKSHYNTAFGFFYLSGPGNALLFSPAPTEGGERIDREDGIIYTYSNKIWRLEMLL